jgi:bifunctional DNA-binding transcriptional regulator/antitoxin component of YhaV-PrlF toxin-antitoxin module
MLQEIETKKFIAKVFQNGKITIPSELRKMMKIRDGDFVQVIILRKISGEKHA